MYSRAQESSRGSRLFWAVEVIVLLEWTTSKDTGEKRRRGRDKSHAALMRRPCEAGTGRNRRSRAHLELCLCVCVWIYLGGAHTTEGETRN